MERLVDEEVGVGANSYALYGHDWRARPPGQWLDQLADRGFEVTPDSAPEPEDQVIVLSRDDFEAALTDAFKQLHRPDQLQDNPLLYSRVVTNDVGAEADVPERIEALRLLIEETTEQLSADPRDEKYYRAVHRTYIKPAPTQETAAEQLGVPFSTFRRHLNRGLDRVTDILWDAEVGSSSDFGSGEDSSLSFG
jgi:DNA-directed RNA polymerase specialized sigma24 family protein